MSDDRLWICCTECGECEKLLSWGFSGMTTMDVLPRAPGFVDEHTETHRPTTRNLKGLFRLAVDDEVVLGKATRPRSALTCRSCGYALHATHGAFCPLGGQVMETDCKGAEQ